MGQIGFTSSEDDAPELAAPRKRRRRKSRSPARGHTSASVDKEDFVDVTPAQLKRFFQRAGGRMCSIMVAANGWIVISRSNDKQPAECFIFSDWKEVSLHVRETVGARKKK